MEHGATAAERGRVLIIDDQASARAWARLVLENEFTCFATGSVQEFFNLALHEQPDVILADLEMRPVGGLQLCRMTKANATLATVPFILLTGHESTDDKVMTLSDGADDHLSKSIAPRELLGRVRATVRLRRAMLHAANLEGLVQQRTRELTLATESLRNEVSERERIESELRLAQKLEAVGQLAAGVAHEINTPMQYIGDSVHFLSDAFSDLLGALAKTQELIATAEPEAFRERALGEMSEINETADLKYLRERVPGAIATTLQGVERVTSIVRAMRELAHPGQKEKAPADLRSALESALTLTRNEYKYVADVETSFGDLSPVHCDVGQLSQVFVNLIVNAAHAIAEVVGDSGEKGKISVSTEQVLERAVIRIRDTGAGIPESVRARIFDPFFTTKPLGKGTGQGLAIAHAIVVEKHGGRLTFETELGRGTCFSIEVPIEPGERLTGTGLRPLTASGRP